VIRAGRWVLIALLAWWTVQFALEPLDGGSTTASLLNVANLVFHEAGHVLFSPFGSFMTALGGSLTQVLVPVVCAIAFVRQEDRFAAAACGWWAGQNLVDVAPYIADARALQLVLLGGSTGAEVEGHDWEAILQSLGWLHLDRALGLGAHYAGLTVMVAALLAAGWFARRQPER
jgi:hypothetical protein